MKKIIFIRHGRAEDPSPEISDFERSLTLKGKAISKLMARKLKEEEEISGVMITSPAFRALETSLIFAGEFGVKAEDIRMVSNIYHKMNFRQLNEILSQVSDKTDMITIFGHNPSFTELVDSLSKEGCDFMPKCGIICISFKIKSWSEIDQNTGKIEYFLKPE
jgi:phosphohistidine phosphatase